MAFVHLNVHSCYSLLAGSMRPDEIPALARRRGFDAIALTDTDGLHAVLPFQRACEKEGLRPILGAEITRPRLEQESTGALRLAPDAEDPSGGPSSGQAARREPGGFARERPAGPGDFRHRATLLARNEAGYRLLGEILTTRHLDDRFALEDALASALDSGDLYVLCAGEGLLRSLAPREREARREGAAGRRPREERLFVELRAGAGPGHLLRLQTLLHLAERLGLPCVATAGAFFAAPEDYPLHRILSAMRVGKTAKNMPLGAAAPKSAWLMGEAEMRRALGLPRPEDLAAGRLAGLDPGDAGGLHGLLDTRLPAALERSARIAADCELRIPTGRPRPPRFALPPGEGGRPQDADAFLYRLAHEGLRERLGIAPGDRDPRARRALAALRRELHVIRRRGVSAYFLIAWDLVRYGRSRQLASLGRGSAAGSLVSFALSVTHVNPLEHRLYFERFLNLERAGLPDFDIDFGSEARYEVLDYAFERYGRERVAMIGTYQSFRPRGAFRALVGALGLDEEEWDETIKLMPRWGSCEGLRRRLEEDPKTRHLDLDAGEMPRLLELAARIGGMPRHLGTHPCGIVIAPGPIAQFVPLQRGGQGLAITQWDMHSVEDAGLVKMDVLGQRGLAVIDATAARVRENFGQAPRLAGDPPPRQTPRRAGGPGGPRTPVGEAAGAVNPFLDRETQALLASGRTEGCFYIESPIMMQILRQARCRDFETLTALSSIIRPGVSSHGGKRQYLLRHLGREAVSLPHTLLEPVLRDTYGCLIYQEQVIRVIQVLGGMSLGEADRFRKIMSGKGGGDPADFEVRFMAGALRVLGEAGESEEDALSVAKEICRQVASFAGYAFCKAHSASFARESFESAWWKAHYPAEFMASVIEERGGYYATAEYVEEARRLGLEILPPHVNAGTVRTLGFGEGAAAPDPAGDGGQPARADGGGASARASAAAGTSGVAHGADAFRGRVRVGLSFMGGVRRAAQEWLADEGARRPFVSLRELVERVRMDPPASPRRYELARLVRVGALDGLPVDLRAGDASAAQVRAGNIPESGQLDSPAGGPGEFPRGNSPRAARSGHVAKGSDCTRVQSGAAAALAPSRDELLHALAKLWPEDSGAQANAEAFAVLDWPAPSEPGVETRARAGQELRYLGFTPSTHPLLLWPGFPAARAQSLTARALYERAAAAEEAARDRGEEAESIALGRVSLLGIKVSSKRTRTEKDGRLMAFVTFSDETGNFEAVFYPDDYARLARRLRGPGPFRIAGEGQAELGEVLVEAREVERFGTRGPTPGKR